MGSDIKMNFLKKFPKKAPSLGFENLVKPEYLNRRSNTQGNDANDSINAKFSNEIKNYEFLDPLSTIKNPRLSNAKRIVIGNLIINSVPDKFIKLKKLVLKYVNIWFLTETKLHASFPNSQCLVDGFSEPFRIDRSRSGDGEMIYVRDEIPSKFLTKHFFRKCKWL